MIPEGRSGVICRTCGASLRGDEPLRGHCLACLLDAALDERKNQPQESGLFDHYRLTMHPDGTPVELGRGAMGVTYKAFDVDLRCAVTLKVISEKYVGDESARLRFLREARAAASRPSSKRCLGLPPWQNRRELLLRDGVCRGRDARETYQTLGPA